jgi:hypothetical protein
MDEELSEVDQLAAELVTVANQEREALTGAATASVLAAFSVAGWFAVRKHRRQLQGRLAEAQAPPSSSTSSEAENPVQRAYRRLFAALPPWALLRPSDSNSARIVDTEAPPDDDPAGRVVAVVLDVVDLVETPGALEDWARQLSTLRDAPPAA